MLDACSRVRSLGGVMFDAASFGGSAADGSALELPIYLMRVVVAFPLADETRFIRRCSLNTRPLLLVFVAARRVLR